MSNRRRLLALLATSALLAGCGFQLRGTEQTHYFPFRTIYLDTSQAPSLGEGLRRQLVSYGDTAVVSSPKEAEVIVSLLRETRDKTVLSLNSQGRVREYRLEYSVAYRVSDSASRELLPAAQFSTARRMTFNENAALGKEHEEAMIYRDMQNDMVQQILRRLAALRLAR